MEGNNRMNCPNCGVIASAHSNFCVNCGARLRVACPGCGEVNSAVSRYCHACGRGLVTGTESTPFRPAVISCPRCRASNAAGADFCYSCGLPFDEGNRRHARTASVILAGQPAGFWIRAVAAIIDGLCLAAVEFLLIVIAPGISVDVYFSSEAIWGTGTWVDYATLLTGIVYYTVGVSVWATTIGKRVVGIYVLRPDGSKLGPGRAFARYWAPILSALILFIGFLMVAFRQDKRALHDLICDTVVVKG